MEKFKSNNYERRSVLLEHMQGLGDRQINCLSCQAPCCTSQKNSMQVTPLEALDIYFYLKEHALLTDELISRLQECVDSFGLNREVPGNGGRAFLRRYYSCPLQVNLRCIISSSVRPYGCLGFNPLSANIQNAEDCISQIDLLEKREKQWIGQEDKINQELRASLHLEWIKRDIPRALLEFINLAL